MSSADNFVPDPNKLALVIGIDLYHDKNLDQLPSCKKDAQDIVNLLSLKEYTIFEERPIIGSDLDDKEYGWVKIRENIGNFFTTAKPSQTLLFYFSGHGILKGDELYLATPQIDTKDPATKGYSVSLLTKYVKHTYSKRIVCIIDSCYSGTANLNLKSKAAKDEADKLNRLFDRSWKHIPKVKGIYLLLSSQSYEKSWAEEDNSIFTKYVIEGLKGVKPHIDKEGRYIEGSGSVDGNGDVTPDSLHDYVYYKVNSITEQTPELKIARASKIVLAEYPDLAKVQRQTSQKDNLLQLLKEGKIDEFNETRRKDNYSRLNFYNVDLNGKDLSHADLRNIDLNLANLIEDKLHYTIFQEASLLRAHLTHADLTHADLTHADLSDAYLAASIIIGVEFPDSEKHYPRCKYTDFGNTAIIDDEKWCRYFRYNNANLVPPAIKDKKTKKEIRKKRIRYHNH